MGYLPFVTFHTEMILCPIKKVPNCRCPDIERRLFVFVRLSRYFFSHFVCFAFSVLLLFYE